MRGPLDQLVKDVLGVLFAHPLITLGVAAVFGGVFFVWVTSTRHRGRHRG